MDAPDAAMDLPLQGMRVLDLTRLLPGPAAGMHLGQGWETLKQRNPQLVLCSISGYGQSGYWNSISGKPSARYLAGPT